MPRIELTAALRSAGVGVALALLHFGAAQAAVAELPQAPAAERLTLQDTTRQRAVPLAVYRPAAGSACLPRGDCPVAFISPGYGGGADGYGFLARALNRAGYLVVGVQMELPGDTPIPTTGEIQVVRAPFWRQGADTLGFLLKTLPQTWPGYQWQQLVLIGHSNGGDISALFAREHPAQVAALITLDHRRFPLPRTATPRTLTLRSADQVADAGVLPSAVELPASHTCVVPLPGALHNDMHDGGPQALRHNIEAVVLGFLQQNVCPKAHP
jgi:pimeloyl-ACP methyl ester carboxylesterase